MYNFTTSILKHIYIYIYIYIYIIGEITHGDIVNLLTLLHDKFKPPDVAPIIIKSKDDKGKTKI